MRTLIFSFLGILAAYLLYRYARHRYEVDKYRDFLPKETMLKMMVFEDLLRKFKEEGKDNAEGLAAGVLMVLIGQSLSDLKPGVDSAVILTETEAILDKNSELLDIMLTYLRTKNIFEAMYKNNLHFLPLEGPTSEVMMKYGSLVPGISDYHQFFHKFKDFSEARM